MSLARAISSTLGVLSILALASPARADKRAEGVARDALKKAETDYLATSYAAAAARLKKALRVCGTKRCAPETRALLLRDIGTMQLEAGDEKSATASWNEALELQPNLDLSAAYDRPEVRAAWNETKNPGSGASAAAPSASAAANEAGPPASASHDVDQAPPPQQAATALPVQAEGPPASGEAKPDSPSDDQGPVGAQDEPGGFARLWVGLAGALDFVEVPTGDDVCKLSALQQPANTAGFYCTNPDGSDFPSRASSVQNAQVATRGQAGHVDGGLKVGNERVLLAIDYALTRNLLAGGRFGYVLGSYTGDAAVKDGRALGSRFHLELRATYVLGHDPLGVEGFAPLAFAAAGVSEFDSSSTSAVTLSGVAGQQPVTVWLTHAPFFVAIGGGVRYQFSPRMAFTGAVRVNGVFGGNGFWPTYGPEIAAQYGF